MHQLRALGAGAETRVAVLCERSPALLVALVAILKTGACYVPVDPAYPRPYIEQILQDAEPQIVLVQRGLPLPEVKMHAWLDVQQLIQAGEHANPPLVHSRLQQLACVMYTSGSTGTPKGVMVPYGQIENWLQAAWQRWPFQAGEVMLQKTLISFAVSVKELLSGLLVGVPQLMLTQAQAKDSAALAAAVQRWQVTRMHLVPSHLKALLDSGQAGALASLKLVITAGEALPRSVVEQAREQLPQAALWNNYGCTELNDVTYHAVGETGTDGVFLPIGRPIANSRVYVLDEHLRQVPVGVIGELHVDSVGMARGYWGQPGLTAQRFVANPYGVPGARLYKTGDLVRLRDDGHLEFLGRRDHEIKIRGHRVDVRQVEKVIASHPLIHEVVVVGWPQGSSTPQLVAYVVAQAGQTLVLDELRQHLSDRLPTYMVPTLFQVLPALPRLPNGKLDRLGLPEPTVADSSAVYITPRTPTEQKLAEMWSEVLRLGDLAVPRVGAMDNFFNLGGHSLLAAQLFARIRQVFALELPISTLFEAPVLEAFAQVVDTGLVALDHQPRYGIQRVARDRPLPLSYQQERLWFVHKHMHEQRTSYNGTIGMHLRGTLDINALRAAFNVLVARHETLRTTVSVPAGYSEPMQMIANERQIELVVQDATEAEVLAYMDQLAGHIYDMAHGPLLMARVLRLSDRNHVLMIGIHHIVFDAWSLLNVMSRDLHEIYEAQLTNREPALPPLSIQYVDYAVWQRSQDFSEHLSYWKSQLADYHEGLRLPYDYARPPDRTWRAATFTFRYPDTLVKSFARFNQEHQATLFMGLVASLAM
ncbi:MAG: amino acid adenylation domain-containing protein, partial [Gammaproteobacteria bacterium]|nr:amino acid adenylation domain-containing protein [Gammaproteobacteria bacterium]